MSNARRAPGTTRALGSRTRDWAAHLRSYATENRERFVRYLSAGIKQRYRFRGEYFARIGTHGERMMRSSCATQVSVDYYSERDAVRKIRVASAIAPVLVANADNPPSSRVPRTTPRCGNSRRSGTSCGI